MFKHIKPIRHYFPDIVIAKDHIKQGIEKYRNSKKFTFTDSRQIARGLREGKYYIDPALCAIMYAVGVEPKMYDLNTPAESYGWNFDETRDLLSALSALYDNDPTYWNMIYGEHRPVQFKTLKRAE